MCTRYRSSARRRSSQTGAGRLGTLGNHQRLHRTAGHGLDVERRSGGRGLAGQHRQHLQSPGSDLQRQPECAAQYGGAAQEAAQGLSWFNTKCWAAVPQGVVRPGNTGRYTIWGPGFFNWDASLYKNFRLTGDGRIKLQLRAETFNGLNWVNPGVRQHQHHRTTFGQISSFRAARRMQLAAKMIF